MKRGNIYSVIPVELVSFNANVSGSDVVLNWITATETNNYGFEIERKILKQSALGGQDDNWRVVGFIEGKGTTTEIHHYSFNDKNLLPGKYRYRLKQIDFDGSINYSNTIEVNVRIPVEFSLEQNFPNPFNPSTKIKFIIPQVASGFSLSKVSIKVYDMLGREAATLVDEFKPAGSYEVEFNASNLSSGTYFYRITADKFSSVKKMILVK
jgi:hypothetical protein